MIGILIAVAVVVLAAWICLICMESRYESEWTKNFELDLTFSEEQAAEGDCLYLYEVITNDKKRILPAVCVKFRTSRYLAFEDMQGGAVSDYFYRNDVISVRGFEKVRRKLRFCCTRRGVYHIEEAELVGNDYFLHRKYVEKKELHARLVVYPSFVGVKKILPVFEKGYGELSSRVPIFEDPFENVGVREYRPGDSMSRINWKASAKTGHWQIRTSAYTSGEPTVVVLNLESPGTFANVRAMEENIRIAYSIIFYLDSQGIATTLVSNGSGGGQVAGNGRGYMADVRRRLAEISYDIRTKTGADLLQQVLKKASVNQHVFFISAAGKPDIQSGLVEFRKKGISVTWVATIFDGEDDTKNLLPGIEACLFRWKG